MDTNKKLKDIIAKVATKPVEHEMINDRTILTSDLGFDSIQIISLIIEIETEFEIDIEDEDLEIEKLTVYSSLYDMIERKLNKKL